LPWLNRSKKPRSRNIRFYASIAISPIDAAFGTLVMHPIAISEAIELAAAERGQSATSRVIELFSKDEASPSSEWTHDLCYISEGR
jgi:hypothetical protein